MDPPRGTGPSLERRLPLAAGGFLLVVLAGMAWIAYVQVARGAREAASERVQALATRFGEALRGEAVRVAGLAATHAARPGLARYLRHPTGGLPAGLLAYEGPRAERLAAVQLLDEDGTVVADTGAQAAAVPSLPAADLTRFAGRADGVGPFLALHDSIVLPVIASVRVDAERIGYLVHWWRVTSSEQERQATVELIGQGARLLIGSPEGVWTDQARMVPAPPVNLASAAPPLHYAVAGAAVIAGAASVRGTPWMVAVELSEASVLAPARRFLLRLIASGAVVAVLGLGLIWLAMHRLTRPLRELTEAAEALSHGEYRRRVPVRGGLELGRLARSFNGMADQIEETHHALELKVAELGATREQFVHAQRMEAVGRLAGGIAHDFNNILSIVLAECEMARDSLPEEHPVRESITDINDAARRAAGLTRQLLAFSRRQLIQPTVFSVNDLIADLEKMLVRLVEATIDLKTSPEATEPLVRADRGQLEQVLVNLVVNARDAMPRGGTLAIVTGNVTFDEAYAAARSEVSPGRYVMIAVSDSGVGIPPEVRPHLFEPFFTTKERGKGTGLGLATCFGIVKQSGGHIAVYTEVGVGTTFRVYLPAADDTADRVVEALPPVTTGTETVLLVEDDDGVRSVAARILRRLGYLVLEASSAEDALPLHTARTEPLHLLITDVVLPTMGGRDLAARIQAERPGIRVLFMTGYTDDVVLHHQLAERGVAILQKPFTAETLGRKVRTLLDAG